MIIGPESFPKKRWQLGHSAISLFSRTTSSLVRQSVIPTPGEWLQAGTSFSSLLNLCSSLFIAVPYPFRVWVEDIEDEHLRPPTGPLATTALVKLHFYSVYCFLRGPILDYRRTMIAGPPSFLKPLYPLLLSVHCISYFTGDCPMAVQFYLPMLRFFFPGLPAPCS